MTTLTLADLNLDVHATVPATTYTQDMQNLLNLFISLATPADESVPSIAELQASKPKVFNGFVRNVHFFNSYITEQLNSCTNVKFPSVYEMLSEMRYFEQQGDVTVFTPLDVLRIIFETANQQNSFDTVENALYTVAKAVSSYLLLQDKFAMPCAAPVISYTNMYYFVYRAYLDKSIFDTNTVNTAEQLANEYLEQLQNANIADTTHHFKLFMNAFLNSSV